MRPTFSIKQGDLLPPFVAEIRDRDGNLIDLTSVPPATAVLRYTPIDGGQTVEKAMTILSPPTAGRVQYDWVSGDTDTPGFYDAECRVSFPTGSMTVPTSSYFLLKIHSLLP